MLVIYNRKDHPILEYMKTYTVFQAVEGGYLLVTDTGFAGVSIEDVLMYT